MESENLKELLKNRAEAEKTLKATQGKIIELTGRGDQLSKEIVAFADSKQKAERAKKQALDKFVIGEIPQSEVDITKKKLRDVTQAEAELQELLEATARARESLIKTIPDFNNVLFAAEKAIWTSIYEAIKKDIQVAVGDLWFNAYAAKLGTGFASYQALYADIFGQIPTSDVVEDVKLQVAKEFGLDYFDRK